jgi:predicted MFS family arabinose efflux permease
MKSISQKLIIFILFLVQFIDVLDFMIVMPLGPDFAHSLGLPESKLGWTAGSYTIAAAISGILSSGFIDKFERKRVLIITILGLAIANILSANTTNYQDFLLCRFLAGIFGGPATSICFAIIADLFEEKSRGTVMGKVMGGFSVAAVIGVPLGLKVALHWSWVASFYLVALLCLIVIILVIFFMPQINFHLTNSSKEKVTYLSLFKKTTYRWSFLAVAISSVASFMIIPYISPFIQMNLGFPREKLDQIYLVGGLGSFIAMRVAGNFVDKTNSTLITNISNILIILSLIFCFIINQNFIPLALVCMPFMVGTSIRNVSNFTLFSKIPQMHDRAGFMSVISCIQHIACSIGASLTAAIVSQNNNKLLFMQEATYIAIVLFLLSPLVIKKIEDKVIKKKV